MKYNSYTYNQITKYNREFKYGYIENSTQKRKEQEAIQKILKIIE